jgi:hypothetical protein
MTMIDQLGILYNGIKQVIDKGDSIFLIYKYTN